MPNLHAVKTDTGVTIVDRREGPYSFSPTKDVPVLELTQAELDAILEDLAPAGAVPPLSPLEEVPKPPV